MIKSLDDLLNRDKFQGPLEGIEKHNKEDLLSILKSMLLIRFSEKKLAEEKEKGNIIGPVHLGVGQEAIASGTAFFLRKTDRVFGAHRSHSHVLSLNANLRSFFAEILGRETGLSKGMGGSMHMWDKNNGFHGSVPIVSGTVPIALGSAFAAKLDGNKDVAISFMGDSAIEEGTVHETLNLAALMQLPIIFIVENNMFGSHMHISQRQPNYSTARFADANKINKIVVDGNDVIQVVDAISILSNNARTKNEPGFLEAYTYRWYGHVDWRDDIDVGVSRSKKDLIAWKKRDPIKRLSESLINANLIIDDDIKMIIENTKKIINIEWEKAKNDPYPMDFKLMEYVYKAV